MPSKVRPPTADGMRYCFACQQFKAVSGDYRPRQPLALVDFSNAEERGQLSLWNEECSGICGV